MRLLWLLALAGAGAVAQIGRARKRSNPQAAYPQPGARPHPVASAHASWFDPARSREIPLLIITPDSGVVRDRLPVVILSHGLGDTGEDLAFLARILAGRGYACLLPTHLGSDTSVVEELGYPALWWSAVNVQTRRDRPRDISFLLDRLSDEPEHPLLRGRVDLDRVGAAGHSLGAYTVLTLAGQTSSGTGAEPLRDGRIRAVVAMSPVGPGVLGLTESSWEDLNIPAMTITGTRDTALGTLDARTRRRPFELMPEGVKYHVLLERAQHAAFTGGNGPRRDPRHHEWITQSALAFFDACLLDSNPGRDWLERKQLEALSHGQAKIEQR